MKNTYLFIERPFILSLLAFVVLTALSSSVVSYFTDKSLRIRTEATTQGVQSTLEMLLSVKQELAQSYYRQIASDTRVIEILTYANSGGEEERRRARLLLYRHLMQLYDFMRENNHFHLMSFALADGTLLVRFHAPELYGDHLNHTGAEPASGFAVGKTALAYRFVFPIFDASGSYVGALILGLSLKDFLGSLSRIFPQSQLYFVVRKEAVYKKVSEAYRPYFVELSKDGEWMVQSPRGALTFEEEYAFIMTLSKRLNLQSYFSRGVNTTLYTQMGGKYYKATLIRLSEENPPEGFLVFIQQSPAIQAIVDAQKVYLTSGAVLSFSIALLLFFILRSKKELARAYERLEAITSNLGGGVVVYDREGRVTYINDSAIEMLGYSRDEVMGSVFHDLVHYHIGPLESCPIYRAVVEGREYENEDTFIRKDGSHIHIYLHVTPLFLKGERVGGILNFYDITERKKKEEELFRLATTDHLTGLYNRRFVEGMLKIAEYKANERGIPFSVIMVDIDDFKKVNDTYGHAIGDLVLVEVAKVLRESVRFPDITARWGGEEFLVLLDSTELDGAIRVAERLRRRIEELTIYDSIKVTVSLGVAQHRRGESYLQTVERADNALYKAKREGKNRVVISD